MGKRCFSKCRGLTQSKCTKPCSFVNEQYCRLDSTLKMIPPDCRLIQRNQSRKGSNLSRKGKPLLKGMPRALCTESGVCIPFGTTSKSGPLNFKYKEFTYVSSSQKIEEGVLIHYEKKGYHSHALLKSYQQHNLAYEYVAGQFLNTLSKTPLFLETYGLFVYPDLQEKNRIESGWIQLDTSLLPITPDKRASICGNPDLVCLLIQHIQDAKPLTQYVKVPHFFIHDAMYVFYQVYFTLSMLRKVFTHYDLTCQHVMLYKPDQHGYIEYHYHLPKEVVHFRSPYLVKVKDYGRCFFKGSKLYRDALCRDLRCEDICETSPFVTPLQSDESQDLGLLREYQQRSNMTHPNPYIQSFVKLLEDVQSNQIEKVSEVEKRLRVLIQDPVRQRINQLSHAKYHKLGDLHVYTNGKEVEFISQKNI